MEPVPALLTTEASSSNSENPNSKLFDGKPTLIRGLGLLDSVLLLISGIVGPVTTFMARTGCQASDDRCFRPPSALCRA